METESRSLAKESPNFATEAADERRISIPNFTSGDLQILDEKVKSMMETSTNILPNGRSAKVCKVCVEKKDKVWPSEITLRLIIWRESLFHAISVERSAGPGRHLGSIHVFPNELTMKNYILLLRSRSQLRKHNCAC